MNSDEGKSGIGVSNPQILPFPARANVEPGHLKEMAQKEPKTKPHMSKTEAAHGKREARGTTRRRVNLNLHKTNDANLKKNVEETKTCRKIGPAQARGPTRPQLWPAALQITKKTGPPEGQEEH